MTQTSQLYKSGSIAAFSNGILGAAMLIVVFAFIGIEVFADRQKLIELAINQPGPLILQDILKFLSAIVTLTLISVMYRILEPASPKTQKLAAIVGGIGVVAILVNGSLSLYAIFKAADSSVTAETGYRLNTSIALLGIVVLLMTGLWHLLVNRAALKQSLFPKWIAYLGIITGAMFLIPPLGIVAGVCSIVWSFAIYGVFKRS